MAMSEAQSLFKQFVMQIIKKKKRSIPNQVVEFKILCDQISCRVFSFVLNVQKGEKLLIKNNGKININVSTDGTRRKLYTKNERQKSM